MYTPLKVLLSTLVLSVIFVFAGSFIFKAADVLPYLHTGGSDLIPFPIYICLICSISSYTIFLCCIEVVRMSRFHTFCSFFVYPLIIAFLTVVTQYSIGGHLMQTAYYTLAFIIPQIYFYRSFNRMNKKYYHPQGRERLS